jgi:hypothetical protein
LENRRRTGGSLTGESDRYSLIGLAEEMYLPGRLGPATAHPLGAHRTGPLRKTQQPFARLARSAQFSKNNRREATPGLAPKNAKSGVLAPARARRRKDHIRLRKPRKRPRPLFREASFERGGF